MGEPGCGRGVGVSPAADGVGHEDLTAPYETIVEHAELELELAGRGEIEALTALGALWEELIAQLPAQPPAAARELLERAQLIHQRTHTELVRLRGAQGAHPMVTRASCPVARGSIAARSPRRGSAPRRRHVRRGRRRV